METTSKIFTKTDQSSAVLRYVPRWFNKKAHFYDYQKFISIGK